MKRLFVAVLVAVAACACSSAKQESNWARLDDISYVMPSHLPAGWALAYATERPGEPFATWTTHTEIYANAARDEFVLLGATKATKGRATQPSPPSTETDFDPTYAIVYVNGGYEKSGKETITMDSHWRSATLQQFVLHVATRPDASMVKRLASDFKNETDFAFDPPPIGDGFRHIGSSGQQVTDYTMVFVPKQLAGSSRNEATRIENDAPSIGVNVGAHYFAQRPELTELDKAEAQEDEPGHFRLEFVLDGSSVRVSSDFVSERELVSVARSLETFEYKKWQKSWGERLRTQDVPGED